MKHINKISENNEYLEVDGNKWIITVQDGNVPQNGVNGLQASDLIYILRSLFYSLNQDVPCRENSLTITHLDEAYHWQLRRTIERELNGTEGTDRQ